MIINVIYIFICILWEEKNKLTIISSWQACFVIAHPDEWAITKQACWDEIIVYLFFPLTIYAALHLCIEHCFTKTKFYTLCTCICIYLCICHIHKCFPGKCTTDKIDTKLHLGPTGLFSIPWLVHGVIEMKDQFKFHFLVPLLQIDWALFENVVSYFFLFAQAVSLSI